METSTTSLIDERDFATLDDPPAYARYFAQLAIVFSRLLGCYGKGNEAESHEAAVVRGYLERLLCTVQALRLKYTYRAGDLHSLWIDVTESGFPNAEEVTQLAVELQNREQRLVDLPAAPALKQALLDQLLRERCDSPLLLQQLGEHAYLQALDERKLLLPFVPGELVPRGAENGARHYVFSWACYDHASNRPYLHVMSFDQDEDAEPLESAGASMQSFLAAIKAEGSRAPDVGVLALAIDEALEPIHPKIVKRICVGPLYSRLLLEGRPLNRDDHREAQLCSMLSGAGAREDDFVLFFQDEIVFSKRQQLTRSLLSPRGRVREIFAIEETDPECFARRASVIHRYVLLPHRLLQHLEETACSAVRGFNGARRFTFDDTGEVHGS